MAITSSALTPDRQAWHDRLDAIDDCQGRELARLYGRLIAYGWLEQNTGAVGGCYRATRGGARAAQRRGCRLTAQIRLGKRGPIRDNSPIAPITGAGEGVDHAHPGHLRAQHRTTFSFEFFPPKTEEAFDELFGNIARLQELQPSFVSVTYGAGGSTRERTHDLIVRIQRETDLTAVSHLTCVCHTEAELAAILDRYAASGHREHPGPRRRPAANLANYDRAKDAFHYARTRALHPQPVDAPDPRGFGVGVAGFPEGHPGRPNRLKEMDYLKAKVDAGADYICTQLFFDNRDFYDFRERCDLAGIKVPILAGIMPIASQVGHDPHGRAGPRVRASRPGCMRAVDRCAATTTRSPGSASTGRPSSAATCSTTTSAASTSTRSTSPTRPGRSTRTSASRTPPRLRQG